MSLETIGLSILNGLCFGFLYALISFSLSYIFGVMRVINVAHGDFFMLGALIAYFATKIFGNYFLGIFVAMSIGFLIGVTVERFVFRGFEYLPAYNCLLSIGLSFILQQIVFLIFGGLSFTVPNPIPYSFPIFGVYYPIYMFVIACFSIILLGGVWVLLFKTDFGIVTRAVIDNKEVAEALGINGDIVRMLSFGLGTILAFLAGYLAAPILNVHYRIGLEIITICFICTVIGGLGNLKGTVIVALALSLCENLLSIFFTPTTTRVFSLIIMLVTVVIRTIMRR
jgi:branched-chain amino acid transport system permease protein